MDTELYTGVPTATRGATAYDAIKRSLLGGAYPLGRRLAEERLAREVGVSRTPVREALARLHAEGLVDRLEEGGYAPTAPDLHEIVELYEVRAALEHRALSRRDPGHDVDALAALRDDWRELATEPPDPDPSFVLIDEDFHVRLAAAAGNRSLVALLTGVNDRIRTVRMHDFLSSARVEATIDQHLSIVEAALAGDHETARSCLADHLAESATIVQRRAAEAIARMVAGPRRPG